MFALLAAICFFFALFDPKFHGIDLVIAGLLCVALHLFIGGWTPSNLWRRKTE